MKQGSFITGTHEDTRVSARRAWNNSILEKTIVKAIRGGLTACRIQHYRIPERMPCGFCRKFTGEPSERGVSDIGGWITADLFVEAMSPWARPLFIEVKRPSRGIESAVQKEFIDRARKGGAIAFFCRGWDECAAELRAAGVKLPEGV